MQDQGAKRLETFCRNHANLLCVPRSTLRLSAIPGGLEFFAWTPKKSAEGDRRNYCRTKALAIGSYLPLCPLPSSRCRSCLIFRFDLSLRPLIGRIQSHIRHRTPTSGKMDSATFSEGAAEVMEDKTFS